VTKRTRTKDNDDDNDDNDEDEDDEDGRNEDDGTGDSDDEDEHGGGDDGDDNDGPNNNGATAIPVAAASTGDTTAYRLISACAATSAPSLLLALSATSVNCARVISCGGWHTGGKVWVCDAWRDHGLGWRGASPPPAIRPSGASMPSPAAPPSALRTLPLMLGSRCSDAARERVNEVDEDERDRDSVLSLRARPPYFSSLLSLLVLLPLLSLLSAGVAAVAGRKESRRQRRDAVDSSVSRNPRPPCTTVIYGHLPCSQDGVYVTWTCWWHHDGLGARLGVISSEGRGHLRPSCGINASAGIVRTTRTVRRSRPIAEDHGECRPLLCMALRRTRACAPALIPDPR